MRLFKDKHLLIYDYMKTIYELIIITTKKHIIQSPQSIKQKIIDNLNKIILKKQETKILKKYHPLIKELINNDKNFSRQQKYSFYRKNHLKSLSALTLMEILIFFSLVGILTIIILLTLNPKKQVEKSWDGKRKNELGQLKKILEDWYNDKQCYPKPNEICYDPPVPVSDGSFTCHICGNQRTSPSLSPYLSRLPCDPQHPTKDFLYQVNNNDCPSWYKIYSYLSSKEDPIIETVGCRWGCGPINTGFSYQYVVTSPNTGAESGPGLYYCSQINNCTLIVQDQPGKIKICNPSYRDPNCSNTNCPQISECYYEDL